jgi:hypothetical protein
MVKHTTKEGECISSIAYEHGFFWDTIWNLPENAELKSNRTDPNILFPGDEVFIPEKRVKSEQIATEQRHRFVLKGVPIKLCLRVLECDEPRADEPYSLLIDGVWYNGITDSNGYLEVSIQTGNAHKAKLIMSSDGSSYDIDLGAVDPISEIRGIQQRLNNLGYDCGAIDNILGLRTREAIRQFQVNRGLPASGELDHQTMSELEKEHGS